MYGFPYDNYMRPPPPPMGLPPPPPFAPHLRYDYSNGGPTIVELEASELGGTMNGSYVGCTTRSEMSFRRDGGRQQFEPPNDGSPRSLGRSGRVYNRRLGSRTYLVDEGSDIATNKSEILSNKTRPWKEVNDDISARMMAASSDSPPLIPKKDYDDSPLPHSRCHSIKQPMQPSSLHASESGSDEGKETDMLQGANGQLTLYRGPPPRHPYDPFGPGGDVYGFGRMPPPFCGMMPPPPMPMFMHDQFMGMPPPPPPEAFMFPPPPPPMDFEMFTFDHEKKSKKSKRNKMLRKYRSLECISFPPPPPPHMFFPPPGMPPPPPSFVMHPPPLPPPHECHMMPPPFMTPFDCGPPPPPPQLALPPLPPGGAANGGGALIPYHHHQASTNQNASNKKIPLSEYGGGTLKSGMAPKPFSGKNDKDAESVKKKPSGCYSSCCKGFTQVLWLVVGIVLVGLILGLVLGLTLV